LRTAAINAKKQDALLNHGLPKVAETFQIVRTKCRQFGLI
jgi:hypothetical protein